MEIKAVFVRLDTANVKARKIRHRQEIKRRERQAFWWSPKFLCLTELGQKNALEKDSFETCRKRQLKRGPGKLEKVRELGAKRVRTQI